MANRFYSRAELDAVRQSDALRQELIPARRPVVGGKARYVCPACGRDGKVQVYVGNRDSALTWGCVACQQCGDIVGLYMTRDGFTRNDAMVAVMDRWGDVYGHGGISSSCMKDKPVAEVPDGPGGAGQPDGGTASARMAPTVRDAGQWTRRCQDYLRRCAAALPGSRGEQYLLGRGFTLETMRRFAVGYDAKSMRPAVGGTLPYGRPGVIIPYSRRLVYYQARFLKPMQGQDDETKAMKPTAAMAGPEPLFNPGALYAYDAVVVTEGPFDAMSIAQGAAMMDGVKVGAVALNGAHAHNALLDALKVMPTAARLIIALDADEAGQAGAAELSMKLDTIGQAHEVIAGADAWGGFKDANELLQYDATLMADAIRFMLECH